MAGGLRNCSTTCRRARGSAPAASRAVSTNPACSALLSRAARPPSNWETARSRAPFAAVMKDFAHGRFARPMRCNPHAQPSGAAPASYSDWQAPCPPTAWAGYCRACCQTACRSCLVRSGGCCSSRSPGPGKKGRAAPPRDSARATREKELRVMPGLSLQRAQARPLPTRRRLRASCGAAPRGLLLVSQTPC